MFGGNEEGGDKPLNRLFSADKLASLAMDTIAVNPAARYTAVLDQIVENCSTVIHGCTQSFSHLAGADLLALQSVFTAAERVDFLPSIEKSMQALADAVTRLDAATSEQAVTQVLLNAAASVELMTSAQKTLEPLASIVAGFDSLESIQAIIQPQVGLHLEINQLATAKDAIQPILDAAARFDSWAMAEENISAFAGLYSEVNALAKDAVQSLAMAAARFDQVTFPFEAESPLTQAIRQGDLVTPFQGHSALLHDPSAELFATTWPFEVLSSSQLGSALESIRGMSLEPTLCEIAADRVLHSVGDKIELVGVDLYPRLAHEALESFSHSQWLSRASIEQISALGGIASPRIREFDETSSHLGNIVRDLGVITSWEGLVSGTATALMPNVAEIARTYKGYVADVVGLLGTSLLDPRGDIGLIIPTRTTATYVDWLRTAVVADEEGVGEVTSPEPYCERWETRAVERDHVFQSLGPNCLTMWQGSWAVLDGSSPDRIRQSAHSARELLMQMLVELAPDTAFSSQEIEQHGYDGKVTRRMRVKKILGSESNSTVAWADAVAKALEETYVQLVATSHDRGTFPRMTERQMAALLDVLGGWLCFVIDRGDTGAQRA